MTVRAKERKKEGFERRMVRETAREREIERAERESKSERERERKERARERVKSLLTSHFLRGDGKKQRERET